MRIDDVAVAVGIVSDSDSGNIRELFDVKVWFKLTSFYAAADVRMKNLVYKTGKGNPLSGKVFTYSI